MTERPLIEKIQVTDEATGDSLMKLRNDILKLMSDTTVELSSNNNLRTTSGAVTSICLNAAIIFQLSVAFGDEMAFDERHSHCGDIVRDVSRVIAKKITEIQDRK